MTSSVDVLLPEVSDLVAPWYFRTPAAAVHGMPPHITLLWPWVEPVIPDALDRLRRAVAPVEPFQVRLSSTGRFPGVLYLAPEPVLPLLGLARPLWSAFPEAPALHR